MKNHLLRFLAYMGLLGAFAILVMSRDAKVKVEKVTAPRTFVGQDNVQYRRTATGIVSNVTYLVGTPSGATFPVVEIVLKDDNRKLNRVSFPMNHTFMKGDEVQVIWVRYGTPAGSHDVPFVVPLNAYDGKG